jgi:hypothetical protein
MELRVLGDGDGDGGLAIHMEDRWVVDGEAEFGE